MLTHSKAVLSALTFYSDFAELDFSSSGKGVIDVAVPSRLQSRESSGKPLANVRIAVKDSFHLRNIPTWVSNQAYRDTYGKQPTTAASVKRLVELGCVVVGKTKMTPFGNWLEPVDYIDLEAPWNPRADGYQSSGGSSSGSAAACAAYEWLDIVMGADSKLLKPICTAFVNTHVSCRERYASRSLGRCIRSPSIIPRSVELWNGTHDCVSHPPLYLGCWN